MNLERDHHTVLQAVGELHRRGLSALAYEIKTYENMLFGQVYKNLHQ